MAKQKGVRSFVYPEPDDRRIGIKVRWFIYSNQALAKKAAKIAYDESLYWASKGYDYGYCSPGSISKLPDGRFEVCLP